MVRSTFDNFATDRSTFGNFFVMGMMVYKKKLILVYCGSSYSFLVICRLNFSDKDVTWKIKNPKTQIVNIMEIIKHFLYSLVPSYPQTGTGSVAWGLGGPLH